MQSIADLNMGERLSSMLNDVALTVQDILETGMATCKRGGETTTLALNSQHPVVTDCRYDIGAFRQFEACHILGGW